MKPLENADITLKLLTAPDAPLIFSAVDSNRDHLTPFFGWVEKTKQVADTEKFIESSLVEYNEGKQVPLEIWYQGAFAGLIDFHGINKKNKTAEAGYWIDKKFEGKGIVSQACKLLFRYGFDELDLNRIEIRCNVQNVRSSAVAQRLGFVKDGVLRQSAALHDGFQDMEIWSMLKAEFAKL